MNSFEGLQSSDSCDKQRVGDLNALIAVYPHDWGVGPKGGAVPRGSGLRLVGHVYGEQCVGAF